MLTAVKGREVTRAGPSPRERGELGPGPSLRVPQEAGQSRWFQDWLVGIFSVGSNAKNCPRVYGTNPGAHGAVDQNVSI